MWGRGRAPPNSRSPGVFTQPRSKADICVYKTALFPNTVAGHAGQDSIIQPAPGGAGPAPLPQRPIAASMMVSASVKHSSNGRL